MDNIKRFFAAFLVFLGACVSQDGGVDFDKTSRAVFAAAGAMRELAQDPSFDADFQKQLLDSATTLNSVGNAVRAAAVIGADEAQLSDQIAVGLSVIQQTFQQLDPDKYEEYRPYFITAQVLLSVMKEFTDEVPGNKDSDAVPE